MHSGKRSKCLTQCHRLQSIVIYNTAAFAQHPDEHITRHCRTVPVEIVITVHPIGWLAVCVKSLTQPRDLGWSELQHLLDYRRPALGIFLDKEPVRHGSNKIVGLAKNETPYEVRRVKAEIPVIIDQIDLTLIIAITQCRVTEKGICLLTRRTGKERETRFPGFQWRCKQQRKEQ